MLEIRDWWLTVRPQTLHKLAVQICVFQFFIQVKNTERAGVVCSFLASCHQLFEMGEFFLCLENSVWLFCCCLFLCLCVWNWYFVLFSLLLKPSSLEGGDVKQVWQKVFHLITKLSSWKWNRLKFLIPSLIFFSCSFCSTLKISNCFRTAPIFVPQYYLMQWRCLLKFLCTNCFCCTLVRLCATNKNIFLRGKKKQPLYMQSTLHLHFSLSSWRAVVFTFHLP